MVGDAECSGAASKMPIDERYPIAVVRYTRNGTMEDAGCRRKVMNDVSLLTFLRLSYIYKQLPPELRAAGCMPRPSC